MSCYCRLQTCLSLQQRLSVCLSHQTGQVSPHVQETGEDIYPDTSISCDTFTEVKTTFPPLLLQLSASAEVLPPWKQGDYVAEASYTTMTSMSSVSSSSQLHMEKHWEQQVTATREVRRR